MNVTVSKCIMDEKSSASSQSNQNDPNSGTNNGGGSSGSGSSYGSTNNGGGSSGSGSSYGMRIRAFQFLDNKKTQRVCTLTFRNYLK